MALPEFFSRVADSLRPVADVDPDLLREKLECVSVRLNLASTDHAAKAAFMLAANLAARLYPRTELVTSARNPEAEQLLTHAQGVISAINPLAEILLPGVGPASALPPAGHEQNRVVTLQVGQLTDADTHADAQDRVVIEASGWDVFVDPIEHQEVDLEGGHILAWLAAGAIGMAEVFRHVFAEELGERGRTGPQPGGLNLLSSTPIDLEGKKLAQPAGEHGNETLDLGQIHIVGAGAIGQAAVYALAHLRVAGRVNVVDPETVTLSNLQRYLLTDSKSVNAVKADLARNALTQGSSLIFGSCTPDVASSLEVTAYVGRWGDLPAHLRASQVLVGLDTAKDRVTVAGTMPSHAYNAWTQVADLGWSRHENFGELPCLACLYYPDRVRPSDHELIAQALNQPILRVLAYLTINIPIGYPLPWLPQVADLPPPEDAERWGQTSLLDDLIAEGVVSEDQRKAWENSTIGALYRDGICAGGILPVGELQSEVIVPLAHQSALAGIMLVAELIWSRAPEFSNERDSSIEHRYDVLRGFPQVSARPRQRTLNCLCSDPIYVAAGTSGTSVGAG